MRARGEPATRPPALTMLGKALTLLWSLLGHLSFPSQRNQRSASFGVQASSGQQLGPRLEEKIDQYNSDRRALRWLLSPRGRFCVFERL